MQGAEWLEDFNSLTFMRCDKSGDIARLVHYKEVEYKGYEIEGDGLKEVTNSAMKYNINMFRKEGGVWKVGYAMDSQVPVEEFSSEEVPQSAYGSRTEFGLK
jgi:hypothetical protein